MQVNKIFTLLGNNSKDAKLDSNHLNANQKRKERTKDVNANKKKDRSLNIQIESSQEL